jgi:DNA-binding MarR family transcriptional regulator
MANSATPDEPVRDLERIVVASVAITARVLAEVAPELTLLQWRVLVLVDEAGDGIAVGAIAAELNARLAATSRLVGRLRDRDLVSTSKDPGDARVTVVRLAPAGARLRTAVVDRRRTTLAWAVQRSGVAIADAPAIARVVRALENAR